MGTRTHVFSTNKAKKAIEKNFSLIVSNIIPTAMEFAITASVLLVFYGPQYFITFVASIYAYVEFTKRTANKRKVHIERQNESDKIGDLLVSFRDFRSTRACLTFFWSKPTAQRSSRSPDTTA